MLNLVAYALNVYGQMRAEPWRNLGNTLLVGEGNLSFARSLMCMPAAQITCMTATTFENTFELSARIWQNANFLRSIGVTVMHGVDATQLEHSFRRHELFDTVIFQFPNVGSRDPKYGHNPNHVLIRKFLRSAKPHLSPSGKVMISAVDSSHYNGAFQFDEAAAFAGYDAPEEYCFDPSMFPFYEHTNTNDDESAIDDHIKFITVVLHAK